MRVPILMYHRIGVDAGGDWQYTVAPGRFERQMRFLATRGYNVISLDELIRALDSRQTLASRVAAITFDDGFQDTYKHARPILKRFRFPATFFLVTRKMGQTSTWMSWSQAGTLVAEGFTPGSHTATHPSLTELDDRIAAEEITGSKRDLEDRLGIPIRFFAYPYGHFGDRVRALVREAGYDAACSVRAGFNTAETDRYALRRLDIHGRYSVRQFARNLVFGDGRMTPTRMIRYYTRRAASRARQLARLKWT